MLRAIVMAAALVAGTAQAGEVMGKIRNEAGGWITFYTRQAPMCGQHYLVIGKARDGSASSGCWGWIGRDVVVVWTDGTVSSFEVDVITFDPEFLEAAGVSP